MKNIEPQKSTGFFTVLSVLLGAAAIITTAAYLIIRCYSERAHREKWKDYNDCGLA